MVSSVMFLAASRSFVRASSFGLLSFLDELRGRGVLSYGMLNLRRSVLRDRPGVRRRGVAGFLSVYAGVSCRLAPAEVFLFVVFTGFYDPMVLLGRFLGCILTHGALTSVGFPGSNSS
jgi:hypothetical protein